MSTRNFVRLVAALSFLGFGSLLALADAAAQQGTISGEVVGPQGPIATVQVHLPQAGLGAMTGADGRYTIRNVTPGTHEVRFSRLGYRPLTEEVVVGAGETVQLNVQMVREALALDEMIVTGTPGGTQRRAIGNVVDRLDAPEIQGVMHVQNVQELLSQRSAGVIQLGQPGSPGGGYGLRVRGMSSVGLQNAPLVYIDGVRMDAEPRSTGVHYGVPINRLNTINPADIASIEIIKGPAAATLYGTEASAGVIQILTHRGAAGAPQFDFSLNTGTNWLWNPAKRVGTSFGRLPDGTVVSDNIYEREAREGLGPVFGYGSLLSFQGSVRGGTDAVNYFVSGSWSDETGVVGFDHDRRFSGRANLDLLLRDDLTVTAGMGYVEGDRRHASTNINNCPICNIDWGSPQFTRSRGFSRAPPEAWRTAEDRSFVDRTTVSFQVNYTPREWLSQRFITGFDRNEERRSVLWPLQPEGAGHFFGTLGLGSKSATRSRRAQRSLDYAGTITLPVSDRLESASSWGFQYFKSTNEIVSGSAEEFPAIPITTLTGGARSSSSETWTENATVGVFVQQQFNWENRLFLTGAVRADDNSAFGAEFDAAIYPKASVAWVISEEPFWDFGWVHELRLRGAFGAAGRQPGTFDADRLYTPTVGYRNEPTLQPSSFGNPQLKPERSSELELGFDASFLDGRLHAVYTRYDRWTRDLIVARSLPPSTGFPGSQIVNLGKVKGWGSEFSLEAEVLERRNLRFTTGLQVTTQRNRIEDLGGEDVVSGFGILEHRVGYSIADMYMMRVVHAVQDADGNLTEILCDGGAGPQGVDFGGPAVPCDEASPVRWGRTEPTWQIGWNLGATLWQRLRLHARVEGAGGHVQSGGKFLAAHTSQLTTEAAVLRNDPQDALFDAYRVVQRDPLAFHKMGFARLREVSGTYTFPSEWVGRIGASRGSVTVSGRNLLLLWTAQDGWDIRGEGSIYTRMPGGAWMWDPELRMPNDTSFGVHATTMPPTAHAAFTLRLGF